MHSGNRLKEERERLNLSQVELCTIIEVTRRTVFNWENEGKAIPSDKLEALEAAGVDILYVVTGTRDIADRAALSERELALLDDYRKCGKEERVFVEKAARVAAELSTIKAEKG